MMDLARRIIAFCLVAFLCANILVRLPAGRVISEDSESFASAARLLVESGSLKEFGHQMPFQAFRSTEGAQPFYYGSISTVLLLFPFFKILGINDRVFWGFQCFLLLLLFLASAHRLGSLQKAFYFMGIGSAIEVWNRGLTSSATTLPAVVLAVLLFGCWDKPRTVGRAFFYGLLMGLAISFRPLSSFFVIYSVGSDLIRRRLGQALGTLAGATIPLVFFKMLRSLLGAAPESDYLFFNIGANVYAWGLDTISLKQSIPLSEIVTNPVYFRAFVTKIAQAFRTFLLGKSFYFDRIDSWMLIGTSVAVVFRKLKPRHYAFLFLLLCFNILEVGVVFENGRYYDIFSALLLLQLFIDLFPLTKDTRFRNQVILGLILVVLVRQSWVGYTLASNEKKSRAQVMTQLEMVRGKIPIDQMVFSNHPYLWNWYLGGRQSCYVPGEQPEIMGELLDKYPNSSVVLFHNAHRVGVSVINTIESRLQLITKEPAVYVRAQKSSK